MGSPLSRRLRRGYTFVELLVTASCMLILATVILVVLLITMNSVQVLMAQTAVTGQLQAIAESLERDIESAKQQIPTNCGPSYVAGSSLLILDVPDADGTGTGLDRVIYRLNNGHLERILEDACPPTVGRTVTRQLTLGETRVTTLAFDSNTISPATRESVEIELELELPIPWPLPIGGTLPSIKNHVFFLYLLEGA